MRKTSFSSSFLVTFACGLGLLFGPMQPVSAGQGGVEQPGSLPGGWSLWPQGIVHVLVSQSFPADAIDAIWSGLHRWQDQTQHAVSFLEIDQGAALPERYVHILTPSEWNDLHPGEEPVKDCGSWAPQTLGPTYVWLSVPGCINQPSILHESGHAIGRGHEHLREDRKLYMEYDAGYEPPDEDPQDAPVGFFDCFSIMLIWEVLDSSTPLSPGAWIKRVESTYPHDLSDGDIDTVRALYAFDIKYNSTIAGGHYADFPLPGDALHRDCMLACAADVRCKAYTYVGAEESGDSEHPHCYLRDDGSTSLSEWTGVHSGLRKPDQTCSFGAAFDVNLTGGRSSDGGVLMPHNLLNGKDCKDLCLKDADCDAFTFVRGMDYGMCYRKTYDPDSPEPLFTYEPRDDYMSGVVRKVNEVPATSNAGGPYSQEWAGVATDVALDGTGSSDPEGLPLRYSWATDCPGGTFNEPASPTPILTVDTSASCSIACNASLVVVDDQCLPSSSDSATVTIQDTIPPVILCNTPAAGTITPKDATVSFRATATDNCSAAAVDITGFNCMAGKSRVESCVVTHDGDTLTISDSGGVGDTISWWVHATDASGNSSDELCSVLVVNPGKSKAP